MGLPSGLFPSAFPTKTLYMSLLSPIRATCPAHLILLYFITRTVLGEEYRLLSSSFCSFLHFTVSSSRLGPNIPLNTLFWITFSLRFSLNGSDQVSQPYKTSDKIIVPHIFIFINEIQIIEALNVKTWLLCLVWFWHNLVKFLDMPQFITCLVSVIQPMHTKNFRKLTPVKPSCACRGECVRRYTN